MKFDTPDVMGWLRGLFGDVHIMGDVRKKRLVPVAAVLLAAIVAVPVLLSKSAHGTPVAQAPNSTPPPTGAIPALSVQSTPPQSNLTGKARNPFQQQVIATTSTAKSVIVSTSSASASTTPSTVSSSSGSSSTGSSSSTGTSPSSSPPSITPNAKPTPPPTGLSSTQAYDVTLAMTNSSGGLNTIDSLKRLSVLPSVQRPLLVELGVMKGGNRVLFAVQPGAVVNGPGTCTPGPIECEILSLGQDETESLSSQSPSGGVAPGPLFAVTAITADRYPSPAAADDARQAASAAGRRLLDQSTLGALSLFQYNTGLGVVLDLRTLTVGGS